MGRGFACRVGRVAVAALSLLVLIASGVGWTQLHRLSGGLSRANVIGPVGVSDIRRSDPGGPLGAAGSREAAASPAAMEQNILLVGLDSRTDAQGNPLPAAVLDQLHAGSSGDGGDSTDTLIVLHIPAGTGPVVAISIPRDSYVQIAGGFGRHKINSAYSYAKNAARRLRGQELSGAVLERASAQAGARTLINTVEALTGASITHYAAMNLVGFYQLSQSVGGVPVCLSARAHDDFTGLDLSAGWHSLQGAQALAFVRQRHGLPRGDLDRIRRQQVFLASMAHRMLATNILTDPDALERLMAALRASVTVDDGFDVLLLARQLQRATAGEVSFATIPTGSLVMPTSDGMAVEVDPAQVRAFVARLDADAALTSVAPLSNAGTTLPSMPATAGQQTCIN
jgi:LCP family protein required for cell wall assembly